MLGNFGIIFSNHVTQCRYPQGHYTWFGPNNQQNGLSIHRMISWRSCILGLYSSVISSKDDCLSSNDNYWRHCLHETRSDRSSIVGWIEAYLVIDATLTPALFILVFQLDKYIPCMEAQFIFFYPIIIIKSLYLYSWFVH